MTRWIGPLRLRSFLLLGAGIAACAGPTREGGEFRASLAVAPVFAPGTVAGSVTVDNIRLRVVRPPAELAADTTVVFPADSARISVVLRVTLRARSERLLVVVELRTGTQVLFTASEPVEVFAESQGPTPTPHPTLAYVGPGAAARLLRVFPRDTILTFGDPFTFQVAAFDGGGAVVPDPLVIWSITPASVGISSGGVITVPSARSTARVRAFTPFGLGDSTDVRFVPRPAALTLVSGDGQSVVAGQQPAAPLVVRVTAADGLAVPGVVVRFRALSPGGSVGDQFVVTDDQGRAGTAVTVGTLAAVSGFEASIPGTVSPVTFGVTVAPGTPAALAIVSGNNQNATAGQPLPNPLVVRVVDGFGNGVPGMTVDWTIVLGGGTLSAGSTTSGTGGLSQVTYTTGTALGAKAVRALLRSQPGVTVLFTATGT